jgi:alpha-tubulin suppressor-like RCC1 family protein
MARQHLTFTLMSTASLLCLGAGAVGHAAHESAGPANARANKRPVAVGLDVDATPPEGPITSAVIQVVAGQYHTCVLLRSGAVRCWGDYGSGKLGVPGLTQHLGDDESLTTLSNIRLGGAASQLAAGYNHTCALLATGGVMCWGRGSAGQLGNRSDEDIGDDELVTLGQVRFPPPASPFSPNPRVAALSAGAAHTCALFRDGTVLCWGDNSLGQLGAPRELSPPTKGDAAGWVSSSERLSFGAPVAQISAGNNHTCARLARPVLDAGRSIEVYCWGSNSSGQLGTGGSDSRRPVAVETGPGVAQVEAGNALTCAVYSTGGVRCWGQHTEGLLGRPLSNHYGDDPGETPQALSDIDLGGQAVEVRAGGLHVCARLTTGMLRCWGSGYEGQLGYGKARIPPAQGGFVNVGKLLSPAMAGDVPVGGAVTSIATGYVHTCALMSGGGMRCWGTNSDGRLGYGHTNKIGYDTTPQAEGLIPM